MGEVKGSSATLLDLLGTSFLHQYLSERILFLISGEQYYIIREVARAKARVIMLVEVPLTSTDTKINALHFMPVTAAPQ